MSWALEIFEKHFTNKNFSLLLQKFEQEFLYINFDVLLIWHQIYSYIVRT